ncbi:MAG TPA: MAC/perforin domain-containing protein, partial [Ilumatobacteraceae bacterium]|nr:MAC/perforin domain-containing protein [Ilumatobacteraceae bacterium]
MSDSMPLRNFDAVGRCVDVLKIDPIDIPSALAGAFKNVFGFGEAKFDVTADGQWSKPVICDYTAIHDATTDSQVVEITSSYSYKTFFHEDASITVSDPTGEAFSSTLSESFETTNEQSTTESQVISYASLKNRLFALSIRNDVKPSSLSKDFVNEVETLPTAPHGDYKDFFADFGTHYIRRATFG